MTPNSITKVYIFLLATFLLMLLCQSDEMLGSNEDKRIEAENSTEQYLMDLHAVVILPMETHYRASLVKIQQAIYLAFEKVKKLGLLPNVKVTLSHEDSRCSNTFAPITAIRSMYACDSNKKPHVFFGPSCELALGKCLSTSCFQREMVSQCGGPG